MVVPFAVRFAIALLLTLAVAPPALTAPATSVPMRDYWPTDEWRVAPPAAQGMDTVLLAEADRRLALEAPLLSAMVVVRGGEIVFERYADDYQPDRPFHTWSVSKSVTGIAVGLALKEGAIGGLGQTLGELIPDRIPADADPRVWNITVEQLLTMTAGFAWDGRINFARAAETDDLDLMLSRPLQCDPGTCFEYDSGSSNLLSYIVQVRTGQQMAEYLQPRIFDPLGIAPPEWIVTEDQACRGGGGMFLTPRDMAKIGYLYLNGGKWNGEQLVPAEWVVASTTAKASGTGYLSGANIGDGPYGYHWWVDETAGGSAFVAFGYGGQYIYVVPDLDLVVVTGYADADPERSDLQQLPRPIIEELIVPAAMGR
ncbi:MAG TPA: serine hydrolase [Thermomicrobiales bacterium]|nr:serine hydrolase [Thermomicrobiales bacterium]